MPKIDKILLSYNFRGANVRKKGKLVMKNGKIIDENWWVDKINAHYKWSNKKHKRR